MTVFSSKFIYTLHRICLTLIVYCSVFLFAGCGSEFGILHDKFRGIPDINSGNELRIFWSENNRSIKKTNSNRTGEITLLTPVGTPLDIALYVPGQKIYWAEDLFGIGNLIKYANFDGTGEVTFTSYISLLDQGPSEIAIDSEAAIIYWNRYQNSSLHNDIWRSDLSTLSAVKWENTIPYPYTFCIALDTGNRKIYFNANTYWDINAVYGSGQSGGMYIAEMDTANSYSGQFTASGPVNPSVPLSGIAVDGPGGHVYYVSNTATALTIIRTDLSFQNPVVWLTALWFDIQKLALDLKERKIYWTSPINNSIYRANIDQPGSGVEQFLQLSGTPIGIAISN